jgi:hypothetical protein
MSFEVPVSAVSGSRGRRGVAAVGGLSGLIVLGAVVAGWLVPRPADPQPAAPALLAVAGKSGPPTPGSNDIAPNPPIATESVARPLPGSIDCHDVKVDQCHRLVRAALRILPADMPVVHDAGVWRSLVCNDNFDCPPQYLRDSMPAGSVTVQFIDGSRGAAINVVGRRYGSAVGLGLTAWVARSIPVEN